MLRSCSRCGKVHDSKYKCRATLNTYSYYSSDEYKLRNTHSWHKKSEEIRKKSNYLCSTCILENVYTYVLKLEQKERQKNLNKEQASDNGSENNEEETEEE